MPHDFQERLILTDGAKQNIIADEHLIRYELAKRYVKGKVVLDLACGSGYGARILAIAGAVKVIAIDVSREAIEYANKNFAHENIDYRIGDAQALDLPDKSIDIITSFETIEHLADQHKYLAELKRVVKPNGLVFISTPNREASTGKNPFHVQEYDKQEFTGLLKQHFKSYRVVGQINGLASSLILSDGAPSKILLANGAAPVYFLAICSTGDVLPNLAPENIVSLNPRALNQLYNNPAVRLANQIYSLIIKIPGLKKLLKLLKPL
ncbi:MAG: class I SAM-dependent methyltransferase [bacterium]|nr:class I SAM-dependent methyltransferase [bacterium]